MRNNSFPMTLLRSILLLLLVPHGGHGQSPAPVAPVTPAPVSPAPVTPAPVTPAPVTPAPVTPPPVTSPPTPGPTLNPTQNPTKAPTPAPVTPAPVTPAPVTSPPTPGPTRNPTPNPTTAPTPAPVTPAPVTPAPVTPAPVTPAPVTPAPVTPAPVTPAPVTPAPVTPAPATPAPTTSPAPATPVPTTSPAPVTPAPATPAPVVANNTDAPTPGPVVETSMPTMVPVVNDTGMPTPATTMMPSVNETESPTAVPTENVPTPAPLVNVTELVEGLQLVFTGIDSLTGDGNAIFEGVTAFYVVEFWSSSSEDVGNFETSVEVVSVIENPGSGRRLGRKLQTGSVTIIYNQEVTYAVDSGLTPLDIVSGPFATADARNAYADLLRSTAPFEDIESVSEVTSTTTAEPSATKTPTASPSAPPTKPDSEEPTGAPTTLPSQAPSQSPEEGPTEAPAGTEPADDGGISTGAIIGIAVAAGLVLILCLLLVFFFSGNGGGYEGTEDPPDVLKVPQGGDEVSTLAAPQVQGTAPTSNESLAGYGDQSVATVDYDYSKAYGGGGDTSVSSAGGTFGSHALGQSALDPSSAGAAGAAPLAGAGSFSDDGSFEAHYRDNSANTKEELLNIFAPPGKLGVVIDTPDDGAPVVHAVKDSSVIADKIHVGDKLVAVDDEDVRSMTAIKVSKLISRKSANPSRKLTIIRTTVVE